MVVSSTPPHRVRDVSPAELATASPRPRIIDVREPSEFDGPLGHIPGAELVPARTLEDAVSTWDKASAIVVVCRSGSRSAQAAAVLSRLGFRTVFNLVGGTRAYVSAGLPIERK